MNQRSDNVIRGNFGNRAERASDSPPPIGHDVPVVSSGAEGVGDSVSSECVRVLDLPATARYKVRFDRIPAYDLQAPRFFGNMAKSGIVTVLVAAAGNLVDGAYLEVTEPDDGNVFRISLSDFIAYVHADGFIEDPTEREIFLRDAMEAYGLELAFRDKEEFDEVSATIVTEESFDHFFPEAMFVTEGTEAGFPKYAYFAGGSLAEDLEMEIDPTVFADVSKITVLHLMMYALDSVNEDGWEIPDDATFVLMKKPYVREGAVSVPFSLFRKAVLRAIDRSFTLYAGIKDESERMRRFFNSYLLSGLVIK